MTVAPLLDRLGSITGLIDIEPEAVALARLQAAETTGRPLGSDDFVTRLEGLMRRRFRAKNERKLWHQARKDAPAQDRDRIIVRPAN